MPRVDKAKNAAYFRKWWRKHKAVQIQRVHKRQQHIRQQLDLYKSTLKCIRCQECDPCCLEFHHIDPRNKEGNISTLHQKGWSFQRILREIKKCRVLCANCHRKEHFHKRRVAER